MIGPDRLSRRLARASSALDEIMERPVRSGLRNRLLGAMSDADFALIHSHLVPVRLDFRKRSPSDARYFGVAAERVLDALQVALAFRRRRPSNELHLQRRH